MAVVKGLLAESVPSQEYAAILRIPQCQCEHPVRPMQGPDRPPLFDRSQEHLRVRGAREHHVAPLELPPNLAMVVELTVERKRVAPAPGRHRLVARRGQVDDGKSAESERDPAPRAHPHTSVIRTTV